MPAIVSIGTALPPSILTQNEIKEFARNIYGESYGGDIDRLVTVFDNSAIEERHFCVPLEWFATSHSFEEKNNLYIENALVLAEQAIARCLSDSGYSHEDIDCLMVLSTTGLSTPSLDARLMNRLPFRSTVRRLPVWGLGCAGGAASLSWARTIACAEPDIKILIIVVELCGLTFLRNDLSKAALIATSLFADGAAAVLVTGDNVRRTTTIARPHLLASATSTLPDSLNVMGWEFCDEGFKIVISRDIPEIVRTFMKSSVEEFLGRQGMEFADIRHFVLHPGGMKVLQAYQETFHITDEQMHHVYEVLRTCGNMSAATVLFVLQRFMNDLQNGHHEYGLLAALGPGFSSELLLVEWR